ncbi:MAG: flagellar hook protein FlgE [Bryobacteraceae bacterium]
MPTSFSTALSGLNAHAAAIDVIGNNLANLNTTGYKANVASFRDLVAQSLGAGAGSTEVGLGTAPTRVTRQFRQGAIQTSGGSMDAAMQGDGFFIVRDAGQNSRLYTRAGNFNVDATGNLVSGTGERVQGWSERNGTLDTTGLISDIVLPIGALQAAAATTSFTVDANLNAAAQAGDSFSAPIETFDSLGVGHILTLTMTRAATPNEWDYEVTIPGAEVGSPNPTVTVFTSTTPLTFSTQGRLTAPAANVAGISVTGLASGAADLGITWELYAPDGTPRVTQFARPSAVSANSQNGTAAAQLVKVAMANDGKIVAQFSSGAQRTVAQLAVAAIRNPHSLAAVGNNNFLLGPETALPAIGLADTGGRGKVQGGALESSTVDIAQEFTNLIIMQRGYQANSRVITTTDELSQETINLKR